MGHSIRGAQAKLAEVLRDSGTGLDEATQLFKELLDYGTKELGINDTTVLMLAAEHARCLELKGSPHAAETYQIAYRLI